MKSFGSFNVNHLHLEPGVYVSRIDRVDGGVIYTIDIRMCKPYVDKLLTNVEMHSIEHIVATNMEAECKEGYIKKVYFGPMGCFEKETKVIMADGSVKNVGDIKVGESVMGDDSTPRKVLSLNRGRAMMYSIGQSNNTSYTVNGKHILSLEYAKSEPRYGFNKGDHVDMTVEEFITKPKSFRTRFKGYKVGYDLPEAELPIPPEILGLWLGDGVRCKPCLCVCDYEPEIAKIWDDYAGAIGCHVNVERDKGRSSRRWIHHDYNRWVPNPFMKEIKRLGLYKNKHIPDKYFMSSRVQRLELLAGLINSDGWCSIRENGKHRENVNFSGTNVTLVNDARRLADSLGFYTSIGSHELVDDSFGSGSTVYTLTIAGDLRELTEYLIDKKKPNLRDKTKNMMLSTLDIKAVGVDDYYGFETDGNERFLLSNGTVVHNCQTGFYALFFVPDSILNTRSSSEIELMIIRIMKNCTKNHVGSVPFNSRVECGNCRTLAKNRRQIEKVNSKLQFMYSLFQNCYLGCSFDDYPE